MADGTPLEAASLAERFPPNVRGAGWIVLAAVVFAVQALIVKILGQRLDSFQVAFFRCLFGLIVLLPFLRGTTSFFLTGRPWLHVARSVIGVGGTFCGFYAITHLPLATATAISFTRPLFLVVLALLFLGEAVHWRRWTATALGFIGVLIVLRPGTSSFDYAMLIGLLGSFFVADVAVLVKKLSGTERNITILFYFGSITTILSAVPAVLVWQNPADWEWPLLMAIGGLSSLAQYMMLRGLRIGEASAVMPFDYTRLIFAGLFGFYFFAEVPDLWTLVGVVILIASTFYIAQREMKAGKAPSLG
jgi:drug/metabolite transporter (DMT)-like permease